jgi:hypothetical protein
MKKTEYTNEQLVDMTMEMLIKRLSEESPHLSNPESGNGNLEIVYNFNAAPRINDRYSILRNSGGEFKFKFPPREYDKKCFTKNIESLYYVVQTYLSTRVVPQGKIIVEFKNGIIDGLDLNNEGTYQDLTRIGKPKINLDDILFSDEEGEE